MKLYRVEGTDLFEGIFSLVLETSAKRAKELVAKGSTVKPEELKCKLLKFGYDRDGVVMVVHDKETGETEFNKKVMEV